MYRNDMNFYEIAEVEKLAAEIQLVGLKQNLVVVHEPCDRGEYRIIAGERRWVALKLLTERGLDGFDTVTCKVAEKMDADLEQIEIIVANSYRKKSDKDLMEEAKRLKSALENLKKNGKEINGYDLTMGRMREVLADMLGSSPSKIAKIESVNNHLIPELKEEIGKENGISFSTAYEAAKLPEEKQKELKETLDSGKKVKMNQLKKKAAAPKKETETDDKQNAEKDMPAAAGFNLNTAAAEKDNSWENGNYETPHPERITSLCYTCKHYMECNLKSDNCKKCDQYVNKRMSEMTEEEKYEKEQERIDRETKNRLREMEQEKKMEKVGNGEKKESREFDIQIGKTSFDDYVSGEKTFDIRKNNGYEVGDVLRMIEYSYGNPTGRRLYMDITYVVTEINGLKDGYCIMSVKIKNR